MDGFPSGQRGQTVNLLAMPSKVRILLHPLYSKFPGIFAWEFCCHTPKRFESFSIHYILSSQVFLPGSFLSLFSISAAQRPDTKLSFSALNTQPRGGAYGLAAIARIPGIFHIRAGGGALSEAPLWPSLLHLLQISVYGKSRNRSSGRQPIGPSSRRPLIFHKYSGILTLMIQHHRPKRWHWYPDHTCLGCIFIFLRSISITVRQHDPLQHRILQSADSRLPDLNLNLPILIPVIQNHDHSFIMGKSSEAKSLIIVPQEH